MSTDLVHEPERRQVRSYHRSFNTELVLYSFGGDLRPWRPIPARGILWAGGIEVFVYVLAHALGASPAFGTFGWAFCYLLVPVGLAWLFTVARPEGRRLHVTLVAWMQHAVLGSHLAGGYQRLSPRWYRPLGPSQIKVSATYEPPRLPVQRRYVVAALPVLVLVATLWVALSHQGAPVLQPVAQASVIPIRPVLRQKIVYHAPSVIRVHIQVPRPVHNKPVRSRRHARAVRRPTVRLHSTPARRTVAPARPVVVVATHPAPVRAVAHQAVFVPQPAPIRQASRPNPSPSCYPGTLGC